MTVITVSRVATPDEVAAEMDRRGAVIERLEANLEHWRGECGKLHCKIDEMGERLSRVYSILKTWDTPSDMDVEILARAVKDKIAQLENINADYKNRIAELLEE